MGMPDAYTYRRDYVLTLRHAAARLTSELSITLGSAFVFVYKIVITFY